MSEPALADLLAAEEARLRAESFFGAPGDALSLRIPGREAFLYSKAGSPGPRTVGFADVDTDDGQAALHALLHRHRRDAGAVLVARSPWSSVIRALDVPVPSLFDEQARHLGPMGPPVAGPSANVLQALRRGGNVAIWRSVRICLGTTPTRVTLNAELFEKCAKAFALAHLTGRRVRPLPWRIRRRWTKRLRDDQRRAAASYEAGRIPEGMDAY